MSHYRFVVVHGRDKSHKNPSLRSCVIRDSEPCNGVVHNTLRLTVRFRPLSKNFNRQVFYARTSYHVRVTYDVLIYNVPIHYRLGTDGGPTRSERCRTLVTGRVVFTVSAAPRSRSERTTQLYWQSSRTHTFTRSLRSRRYR